MNEKAIRTSTLVARDTDQQGSDDLLHYIEPGHSTCEAELQALARHLYPRVRAREALLTEASRLAFVTLSGYLFDNYQEEQHLGFPFAYHPTIGAVGRLATGVGHDQEISIRTLLWHLMQRPFLAEWTRYGFLRLLELSEHRLWVVMQALSEGLHDSARPAPDRLH